MRSLVLETHILVWWLSGQGRLSKPQALAHQDVESGRAAAKSARSRTTSARDGATVWGEFAPFRL
jgi:PIN domain nuclease of toxin-antitoxin system